MGKTSGDILVICIALMLISFAGPTIESGVTLVFLSTYFISYANWLVGSFMPVTQDKFFHGVTGILFTTLQCIAELLIKNSFNNELIIYVVTDPELRPIQND